MRRLVAAAVPLSLAGFLALPAAAAPAGAAPSGQLRCSDPCTIPVAAIQAHLDAAVAAGVPGIVWLVRAGSTTITMTAGVADVGKERPIATDDRFRIASISKMFVAAVVLQLVDEGRIGLDGPVAPLLPGLGLDPRITVRHLLQHTSGLFDFGDDEAFITAALGDVTRRWRPQELVSIATSHPPYFAPGRGWHYSNTGYVVLGLLVERVTGRAFDKEISHRILRPLALRDTYVSAQFVLRGRHSNGYTAGDEGPVDTTRINATLTGASGDLVSTVGDVARFQQALLAGQLLSLHTMTEMQRFVPAWDSPDYGAGLGVFASPQACGVSLGHSGGIFGFQSDAEQMSDGHRQNVVFVNTDAIPDAAYGEFGAAATLSLCGEP